MEGRKREGGEEGRKGDGAIGGKEEGEGVYGYR